MNLGHAQRRAGQPFAKVRDVLTHEIARWRDEAHVSFFFYHGVDRDPQHDLGLARPGRRLEQKLKNVGVESGTDAIDRRALIGGEGKRLAGLD
jgi:hypothetical protein